MNIICQNCQTKNHISSPQNSYYCIKCSETLIISVDNMVVFEKEIQDLRKGMTAEMNKFYASYEKEVNKISQLEKSFELFKGVWETSNPTSKIAAEVVLTNIPAVISEKITPEFTPEISDEQKQEEYIQKKAAEREKLEREQQAAIFMQEAREREELFAKIQQKEQEKLQRQEEIKQKAAYAKAQAKALEEETERQRLAAIPREPSVLEQVLVDVLVPFSQLRTMALKVITHYKKKNQLPVFFMAVGGIIALLLGFVFLMRYADNTFSEISKYVFSSATVAGLTIWGLRLNNNNSEFKEFGSAIVGLACALAYLVVYSITDSPILTVFNGAAIGFVLIFLVTVGTSYLSFRYETKVVAVISLLGGAFAPMYVTSINITIFYFIYLFILSITALFIGRAIKWNVMDTLAFVVVSVAISVVFYQIKPIIPVVQYTIVFLAFAYLFFYVAIFEKNLIPKETLESKNIVMLIGSAGFLVVNLFSLYNVAQELRTLGAIHLANALVFVVGFAIFRKTLSDNMATLFFVISGVFLGFAFPLLLERNVSGIFWALEAVALVYCGFLFNLPLVRKEGYLGLLAAMVKIASSIPQIMNNWELILWTDSYIQLLGLVAVLAILRTFFSHFKGKLVDIESLIADILLKTVAFLLLVCVWIAAYFYLQDRVYILSIIPLYVYVWWGKRSKTELIEILGLLHLFTISLGIIRAITEINNNWEQILWTEGYLQLIGLLIVSLGLRFFVHHSKSKILDVEVNIPKFLEHLIASLLIVCVWSGVYFYMREKTYILGVVGLYSYIFWGHRSKSFFIEILGLAHLILIGYGGYLSVLEVNNVIFALQTQLGKVAIGEIFASMWLLQLMYEKTAPTFKPVLGENLGANSDENSRENQDENKAENSFESLFTQSPTMSLVKLFREVFYLVVPLLVLSPVKRLYPMYLPVAIWASVAINYVLNLVVKRTALTWELYGLIGIGTYLLVFSDSPLEISAMSIAGGLLVLAGIFIHAKGYKDKNYFQAKESYIFTYLFYFIGICSYLIFIGLHGNPQGEFQENSIYTSGLFVVSAYFFALTIFSKDTFVPIKNNRSLAFRLGYLALLLGIILKTAIYVDTPNDRITFTVDTVIWLTMMVISILCLVKIIQPKLAAYPHKEEAIWVVDMIVMNLFITAVYALIIAAISPNWLGVWLSVVIIIHAMVLLFSSTKKRLKFYLRLSIAYFVGVILKLFFNDMTNFSIVQKIIVFMVIGAIMLGGAFLFMKIKNDVEEKEEELEEQD